MRFAMRDGFVWLVMMAGAAGGAQTVAKALAAPTIDQSLEIRAVNSPQISPDGRQVVYEETRTNWEANAFETDLWLADAGTGDRRQLTVAAKSSNEARWSPDGRWIGFLSDRPGALAKSPAGKRQVYVMPADGGEAQQVTKMENGVEEFAWAPDSKRMVLRAEAPETKAMKDREDTFGTYHVFHADYQMLHLWLLELPVTDAAGVTAKAAEPKQLTGANNGGEAFSVESMAWSPDGTRIAFGATRDPDLISSFTGDIYTVTLANDAVKKIVSTPGPDGDPRWSPDGTQIAYVTSDAAKYFFYMNRKIAVVSSDGGTPRVVTAGFDEDAGIREWGPQGIFFTGFEKTRLGLYVVDAKTAAVTKIAMPGSEIAGAFTFSKDFRTVAYRGAGANRYREIYVAVIGAGSSAFAGEQPKQITHAGEQLKGFDTAKREVVRWKSGDGAEVEGVLIKPVDFDPHRKYPLLVVIHGGPTGIDQPLITADRYYPVERFVAKGALVLKPNYRGSAGYGEKFRSLNVRNLGVGDYADVISGVDYLIAQGYVDKDRVGSMGWSEGGYISAFITTASDRFKAVSVGAGISDWMTYYANTDITPFAPQYLRATPWDDPEIYRKTSPISYLKTAKTPTLIQHGGADRRVPIANGFELRQALEDKGVPVKMVIYDGFGHPINKPKQQRAVMEENENWFAHYIWGEPLAASLTPEVKAEK